jgi:hypothetical protein
MNKSLKAFPEIAAQVAAENCTRLEMKANARNEWRAFCKRTNDPKLRWLQKRLAEVGIPSRREGKSFHAPILQVPKGCLDRALEILIPVDDISDDSPRFHHDTP